MNMRDAPEFPALAEDVGFLKSAFTIQRKHHVGMMAMQRWMPELHDDVFGVTLRGHPVERDFICEYVRYRLRIQQNRESPLVTAEGGHLAEVQAESLGSHCAGSRKRDGNKG
jgi:hypothetical protein